MPSTLTEIDVYNRALARIGGGDIAALDEATDLAEQVANVGPDVIAAAFAAYDWRWARGTRDLAELAAPAGGWRTGYRKGFAFPTPAISGPKKLMRSARRPDDIVAAFAVEGRTVFADADTLAGTFLLQLSPDQWPPLFRIAVTTWIAGALCVPVTHDKDLADQLTRDAIGAPQEQGRGGLMARAIAMDHAEGGAPQQTMAPGTLTQARASGPGNWWGD